MKIVSWNIGRRTAAWQLLADSGIDVALVQEATPPPNDITGVEVDGAEWITAGADARRNWRAAVARLSDRVRLSWRPLKPIPEAGTADLGVSRPGTLAVADVEERATGETITCISMYGAWEATATETGSRWNYADASVHRIISDISALLGREKGHRIIAAGDLNVLNRYGEDRRPYWARRYGTVFDRFQALGLAFVGPQAPHGLQASPRPSELPEDSKDVPTFRTRQTKPSSATRQLDFVFASQELAPRLRVCALNRQEEWGPSDHCRVLIELGD